MKIENSFVKRKKTIKKKKKKKVKTMNSLLDKLLLETKSITSSIPSNTTTGLPSLHRNLKQLDAASRKFSRKTIDPYIEQKASNLLAEGGIDPSEHDQLLNRIDTTTQYDLLLNEEDVDVYLMHQYQTLIGTAIEENTRLANYSFRRECINKLENDWNNVKSKIVEELSSSSTTIGNTITLTNQINESSSSSSKTLSLIDNSGTSNMMINQVNDDQLLQSNEPNDYQGLICLFNKNRLHHSNDFELIDQFINIETSITPSIDNTLTDDYLEQWIILSEMIRYSPNYILGALKYTEEEYYEYIKNICLTKPNIAKIGGNPSAINHIKGFLNIILKEDEDIWPSEIVGNEYTNDNYPFWPLMYYLYRSGHLKEAIDLCKQQMVINKAATYQIFYNALVSRIEYRNNGHSGLDIHCWKELYQEYNTKIQVNNQQNYGYQNNHHHNLFIQPYKIALYHIIGYFNIAKDINLYDQVFKSTEDYIWQKLNLISNKEIPSWLNNHAINSLNSFQLSITQHGSTYFNPNQQEPLRYFKYLLLSLQFKQAIYYLFEYKQFESFALHFTIVLYHYNLLTISYNDDLITSSDNMRGLTNKATPAQEAFKATNK